MRVSTPVELEGRILGEFEVLTRLGEGGFGIVFAARQASLARPAVIKVMSASARARPVDVERFLREARVAAAIDHPYAAHIYAFGAEPDGLRWIAMERVDGTPLDQVLAAQGPMPIARFVPFFERVCEVVHHAHARGVVHRDLKPANVMVLARSGRLLPKLLDFGIAGLHGELAAPAPGDDDRDGDAPAGPLTAVGPLGSPHYMAPEQWQTPHAVGPPADLYALGVLAYEALTGRRPFVGQTVRELARAHARGTPAPLGLEGSAALDAVLARAWQRDPAARWGSALELGQAVRAAAGLVEAPPPPRLPAELRAALLVTAPTPIADAVAALDGAVDPAHAVAAAAVIARALLRYLVLIAAAGARVLADGDAILPVLGATGRRSDAEWLALGRQLVEPFGARPEVFPIPEVVVALGDGPAAAATHLAAALTAPERPRLVELVALIARALDAARGVLGYRLAAGTTTTVEAWTGVSRDRRASLPVAGVAPGAIVLIDDDGAPCLPLSPLVLARVPAVGVADALFFLDGHDAGGARFVAWPTGHEHRDPTLGPAAATTRIAAAEVAPFVGLSSFTAADADRFFGREPQIEAVLNRLRVHPLVAVVGPSGVGKTSFVQAGVVPRLPTGWRALTVRPGAAPLDELAARLAELGDQPREDLRARLAADPGALRAALIAAAGAGVLVLVVEQLEELITLAPEDDRRAVAAALARAAVTIDDPVRVIVTLRDDFLVRAQELGALWTRCVAGLELLGPPAPDELTRVLTAPLARVGYDFDDPTLPAEMATSVAGQPGALPLLQFAAARLWEHRDVAARRLTRAAYERLGGVGGALAGHADAIVAGQGGDGRKHVRAAFRQLVTADGTRAVVARADLERQLGDGAAVIEQLIDARLLVARDSAGGEVQIEVVHEALLTAWPQLVAWRRDDAEGLWLRDQLRVAARQWVQRDRPDGLLWRDDALADLARWRSRHPDPLGAAEDAFAAASVALDARQRRRRRIAYGAALAVFAIASAAFLLIARDARRARRGADTARAAAEISSRAAEDRTTQLYIEHGRRALLDDDGQRAYVYLRAAQQRGASGPALETMLGRAGRLVLAEKASAQASAGVQVVAWRPDGQAFASGAEDGTVEIWSATGERLAALRGHTAPVWNLAWAADGERLLSSGADNVPRLWEPERATLVAALRGHQTAAADEAGRGINSTSVSPDGRLIATASKDGDVWVWDATTGAARTQLEGHDGAVVEVLFTADGTSAVTADGSAVRIWSLAAPDRPRAIIPEPTGGLRCVRVAGGGLLVAVARAGPVRVIDPRTNAVVRTLTTHVGQRCPAVSGAHVITLGAGGELRAWHLDGRRLWETATGLDATSFSVTRERVAIGTDGGRVRVFDLATGRPIIALPGVRQKVWAIAMSPDGRSVLAGSLGGALRVYAADAVDELERGDGLAFALRFEPDGTLHAIGPDGVRVGGRLIPLTIHDAAATDDGRVLMDEDGRVVLRGPAGEPRGGPAVSDAALVAITGDGRRAAIAHQDATISLWDVDGWRRLAVLRGHTGALITLAFDTSGERLASGGDDGIGRVWSVPSGTPIATLVGHAARIMSLRFAPGGGLVSGSSDRTVRTWDLPDGTLRATFADHDGEVFAVAVAPDGKRVAVAGEGGVYVWSAEGTLLVRPMTADQGYAVAWDLHGARLAAVVGGDGADAPSGQIVVLDLSPLPAAQQPAVECRLRVGLGPGAQLEERTPGTCLQ